MDKEKLDEAFDKSLQKIFETRDINKLQEDIIAAIERSKKDRLKARKEREYKFKTQGLTLCLSALMLFNIVSLRNDVQNNKDNSNSIAFENIIDNEEQDIMKSITEYVSKYSLDSELNMHNLSKKIGSIIIDKDESILKQCTYIVPNGYGYNLSKAAEKIVSLDKDIQSYAICATLNDMGNNRENYIEDFKSTNEDFLIRNIKLLKISDTSLTDEEIEFWEDIETAKDYYRKVGALDKSGNPSFEVNKKLNDSNAQVVLEIVKQELNADKGVAK